MEVVDETKEALNELKVQAYQFGQVILDPISCSKFLINVKFSFISSSKVEGRRTRKGRISVFKTVYSDNFSLEWKKA